MTEFTRDMADKKAKQIAEKNGWDVLDVSQVNSETNVWAAKFDMGNDKKRFQFLNGASKSYLDKIRADKRKSRKSEKKQEGGRKSEKQEEKRKSRKSEKQEGGRKSADKTEKQDGAGCNWARTTRRCRKSSSKKMHKYCKQSPITSRCKKSKCAAKRRMSKERKAALIKALIAARAARLSKRK